MHLEDESPSLALSTLVLLAFAVLTSLFQVFKQSVGVNPTTPRHVGFAVAGRGEAKRVSLWEPVCAEGASLWQDSVTGRALAPVLGS